MINTQSLWFHFPRAAFAQEAGPRITPIIRGYFFVEAAVSAADQPNLEQPTDFTNSTDECQNDEIRISKETRLSTVNHLSAVAGAQIDQPLASALGI